jgi:Zn-dependent M28 family amino/carboxypeptidase
MKRLPLIVLFAFATLNTPFAQSQPGAPNPAQAWWAHVQFLADNKMAGRDTGSPEHRKAADYVAAAFKRAGLKPAGTKGYLQPVNFVSRRALENECSMALIRNGQSEAVALGDEAVFSMSIAHAPRVEAPLVFVGYGLTIPEAKHDDLAGLDLRGKVVVLLTGGPPEISGPLKAHYQSHRWETLKGAGVIGVIGIQNPRGQDIPWDRSKLARFRPRMALADASLSEDAGQQLAVTFNSARAEKLFAGSGHTFAEILALADAGKPLPHFTLPAAVRAQVKFESKKLVSQNVVGSLPGKDATLKNEYVVLSAHLDHVGTGQPINGDGIYNGAMDNASGVATLIEAAMALAKTPLRRSVLFVAVTAEENGLLGSKYFAARPTVPANALVANVNVDMFLPLFPLHSLIVQGLEESDLADDLQAAGRELQLQILSDPEPERNAFTRSDQYSFIQRGIPSASLKVGFIKGSPEHEIVKRWRAERYHAPSDDLQQPIDFQAAADFNRAYLRIVQAVANRNERPQWRADSFFRRFMP